MKSKKIIALLLATLTLAAALPAAAASQDDKKKQKEPAPQGTPVLWRDPGDVSQLDLLAGPGGDVKPDLTKLTFIKEEKGGYSKKYRVRDAAGRVWVAKIGKEAQPETAAVRLVWAAGYVTEIAHLAPKATIEGKGTFENVRFEARPEGVRRLDEWRWDSNPFAGQRELQGLKVLMALLENWDLKDANNKVLYVESDQTMHHIVSDLGATFGKTGGQHSPMALLRNVKGSRNEPGDYVADKFIDGVEAGRVRFNYAGKNAEMMRDVTVESAKWVGSILSRLSDQQLEDAFRAANYTPEEVKILAAAVRSRINELVALP
ncbi:MAG TPA: hypothetical protein VGX48_21275 [Pyrinomonadaceae bacterium]|jgi:hypothetical protein|nr:hypothetical protein [Pyrinomonadaceae bacterium]